MDYNSWWMQTSYVIKLPWQLPFSGTWLGVHCVIYIGPPFFREIEINSNCDITSVIITPLVLQYIHPFKVLFQRMTHSGKNNVVLWTCVKRHWNECVKIRNICSLLNGFTLSILWTHNCDLITSCILYWVDSYFKSSSPWNL